MRTLRSRHLTPLFLGIAASLSINAAAQAAVGDAAPQSPAALAQLSSDALARFVELALKCVHLEYPNHISHLLNSDADARAPRELTPAFDGCFDWHSSVHGHWLLARAVHLFPEAEFAAPARVALSQSLTPENIAAEVRYVRSDGRTSFERPYGLAWLLQLAAELRGWKDPDAARWAIALAPLEAEAVTQLASWLPKLRYPIRVGEHDQTAFAFGLVWDWAGVAGDQAMRRLLSDKAHEFYLGDRACPLAYEPSGEDFLSPCLGEADFMRRVLPPLEFARWLTAFLPGIPRHTRIPHAARAPWLSPGIVTDRADPKLAHLDGLNLSRAWMLEGMASGLPSGDPRIATLQAAALNHRNAALTAVTGEHYEGGHWLGTFAVYLTSEAGLAAVRR